MVLLSSHSYGASHIQWLPHQVVRWGERLYFTSCASPATSSGAGAQQALNESLVDPYAVLLLKTGLFTASSGVQSQLLICRHALQLFLKWKLIPGFYSANKGNWFLQEAKCNFDSNILTLRSEGIIQLWQMLLLFFRGKHSSSKFLITEHI